MRFQNGTHGIASSLIFSRLRLGAIGKLQNSMWLWLRTTTDTREFDEFMRNEFIFNRRWRHVFALARFENFLGATRNLESIVIINGTLVTGADPSIVRHGFLGGSLILVISHHASGSLDLNFSVRRGNAMFNVGVGTSDIADARFAGFGNVRIIEIFRHAVSLQNFQSQTTVPLQEFGWNGSRARSSKPDAIETEALDDFLFNQNVNEWNAQEQIQFLGWQFGKNTSLKFRPKTRDTEKQGWFAAIQIGDKCLDGFGKKDLFATDKGDAFAQPTFHAVGDWKVGQIAILGGNGKRLNDAHCSGQHGLEGGHDTLGPVILY
mmetsp:Transcript_25349/g.42120  ORF Transcript_25349/g.42120 Transcript_25349/m.42120 type:complete len:320 (+) Transcript_25349:468-1427(+)